MGIGYSVPKECALSQFLAISLEVGKTLNLFISLIAVAGHAWRT